MAAPVLVRRSAEREGGAGHAASPARVSAAARATLREPQGRPELRRRTRRDAVERAVSNERSRRGRSIGEVAKRSNAADCKSVAPAASEVRILPSPSAFARPSGELRLDQPPRNSTAAGQSASRATCEGCPAVARSAKADLETLDAGCKFDEESGLARRSRRARRSGPSRVGGSNSVVESQPSKLLVAGSIPVSRSRITPRGFAPRTPLHRRSRGPLRSPLRDGGARLSARRGERE
jgi:hypothetical protein